MHRRSLASALAAVTVFSFISIAPTHAADHLDAPILQAPGNGAADINDVYAFQSPANPDNTVLIMTVNPFAGVRSGLNFADDVSYQIQIDNDGDAVADISYDTVFTGPVSGSQVLVTTRNAAPYATGPKETDLSTAGGGTIRAGFFDDPFFFDLVGFNDGFNFTGADTFAGADITAIVLEVPSAELGGPNIGVWGRTVDTNSNLQIDRMGRPAINTVLVNSGRKDEFNQADPVNDFAAFGADMQAIIEFLNGGDTATAASLTAILLPDILTFDTSNAGGFLNGRRLEDDVIDAELDLLTNGALTGDGVDANDVPFLNVFPYLAPANVIPEPASLVLLGLGGLVLVRRRRGG